MRWTRKILFATGLGFLVTVLVALLSTVAFAYTTAQATSSEFFQVGSGDDSVVVSQSLIQSPLWDCYIEALRPSGTVASYPFARTLDEWASRCAERRRQLIPAVLDRRFLPAYAFTYGLEVGWPAPVFWGVLSTELTSARGKTVLGPLGGFWITASALPGQGKIGRAGWYLPLTPILPGLAVNTAVFACLFLLLGQVPRIVRKVRHRCPQCGYPLMASTTCPECGAGATAGQAHVALQLKEAHDVQ